MIETDRSCRLKIYTANITTEPRPPQNKKELPDVQGY